MIDFLLNYERQKQQNMQGVNARDSVLLTNALMH